MLGPIDERTAPMTPQLALRVAVIGGVALVIFGVIFFRLWFLQVLSGSRYVAQAQSNVVQHIPVAAPRGEIVDSSGTPLVESVRVPSIQIAPRSLRYPVVLNAGTRPPVKIPAGDYTLFNRLARLLGMSTRPRSCRYTIYWANKAPSNYDVSLAPIPCLVAQSVSQSSYGNATIKTDVPTYIQDYIDERITEFPGVLSQDTYVRRYPLGGAGAQIFGTLGQVSQSELKVYKGVRMGDVVGQSGLEAQYNQYLQGVDGAEGVKVNSQGQFEGYAKGTPATIGDTLQLSVNAGLERVGQKALQDSILGNPGSTGGAFVAMDPQNGQIYAMGSAPTYNPPKVSPTLSIKENNFLNDPANNYPLLNRATQGVGPDGSTFKVITATAALQGGVWGLSQTYNDTGAYCFANTAASQCRHNAGGISYGSIALPFAIQDSVDTFFYNLGGLLNSKPIPVYDHPNGGALQQWAYRYGIGRPTGIDLPGEALGSMASPKYFRGLWKQERECERAVGPYKGHPKHPAVLNAYGNGILSGGCGIADTNQWTIGDNVNAAVGQGDVQVTPLQLAVVYAAVANGGTIVTPHIGEQIQTPQGTVVQKIDPAPRRHLNIQPAYLAAIRQGLRQAVTSGTSADTLGSFPQQVYGKTGTAQYFNAQGVERDSAWYACYVPASATGKPIVVVVWVQRGGYGDVAAAPVARMILGQWFYGKPGSFSVGANKTL